MLTGYVSELNTDLDEKVYVETKSITFSSGHATLTGVSGYTLASIHPTGRPASEDSYDIVRVSRSTAGNYYLANQASTLSASITVYLVWVKN